nr:hypothetical protein [Tanacetum cinerariifolium]
FVFKGGKRYGNKPSVKPLKSTLKKKGVDVVITDTSVDSDFGAGNDFERLDGGSKSDVDLGTNGTDRQHDEEGEADSPKGNTVFSSKTKLRYFDRDDMEFDDMEHVVEEAEHGNASSENG